MSKIRVVIVGGGFAGVQCARKLSSETSRDQVQITLFSQENHMVFDPLLAEVAAATIQPKDMAAPLRELLPGVKCRTEDVADIDFAKKTLQYESDINHLAEMEFDHIVVACGNTSNLAMIPGMADHALPMKTVGDALEIQRHVIDQLERAEVCDNAERRKQYLSFVVVGGGFSGVEIAGELNDLVKRSTRFYSNFKESDVVVTLVHSHETILPEVSTSLRLFARAKMEERGIKFLLKTHAKYCTADGVGLDDGTLIKAATVVCTIGVRTLPMIERMEVKKEKGRLVVNPDMSLPDFPYAWAIGDCAGIINAYDNKISPTTGQFAERQGAQLASNIARRIRNEETRPFSHKSLGTLCSIGGKSAVAEIMGLKISGLLAWMAWRAVYLMKLPSFGQQLRVAIDWTFDLLLPPQLTTLRTDPSKRVGHAHYKAGNFIYKEGEPASDFHVIETGEVELFTGPEDNKRVLAVLGKGDFFGEGALRERGKRMHSARALGDSEVMIIGKNIFSEISDLLSPFRSAMADVIRRRNFNWERDSENLTELSDISLASVMESADERTVGSEDLFLSVIDKIRNERLDFCYVVDAQKHLLGLVTRGDLVRSVEVAATLKVKSQFELRVKQIMMTQPLYCTTSDTTKKAVSIMREHNFARLPVVDEADKSTLKGYLRLENIMCQLGHNMAPTATTEQVHETKTAPAPHELDAVGAN